MSKQLEEPRRSKRLMKECQLHNSTLDPIKEHPLLNGLVLENVFDYLKGQDNVLACIANYRGVCKIWDQEISKILRKYTQTSLSKILAPFQDGLEWNPSPENNEELFRFDTPFPEVRPFENVLMNLDSCSTLENADCVNWFQTLGTHVKVLCFSSPLTCTCQAQFLESILKEWCPNLERLDLMHVKCVDTLLAKSTFIENSSTSLICRGLKELRIDVNEVASYSPCQKQKNPDNIANSSNVRFRSGPMTMAFIKLVAASRKLNIIQSMYDYGRNSGNTAAFPEIVNMAEQLVILPEHVNHRGLFETIGTTFSQVTSGRDGGIMGQLMKAVNLNKLLIRGFNDKGHQDLVILFHFRPNKWRSSLKYLGLDELFSKSVKELHVLAQVKFPLTSLKFGGIHLAKDGPEITRFLSYFADTLEHLEYSGNSLRNAEKEGECQLELPVLPELKTFVHENITAYSVTAKNLFKNAPNLETCFLKGSLTLNWDSNRFFRYTTGIAIYAMKALKLVVPVSGNQAEMFLSWFPNLLKIELVLRSVGNSAYGFFGKLEKSKVEQLKLGFLDYNIESGEMAGNDQLTRFWKPENIKGLNILELENMTNLQFLVRAESFSVGRLTSLKLINFRIDSNHEKQLLEGLSHVASVELINKLDRYTNDCPN